MYAVYSYANVYTDSEKHFCIDINFSKHITSSWNQMALIWEYTLTYALYMETDARYKWMNNDLSASIFNGFFILNI